MEFDIFNPDTWHLVKEDDVFHIDGRDVYVGDFSERMKLADFVKFIAKFISIGEKQFGNFTLERKQLIIKNWLAKFYKYNTIEGRAELPPEPLPLSPETEDKNESGFNPLDESTWNLASEKRIMRIKGVFVFDEKDKNGNPVYYKSESEWIRIVKLLIKASKNSNRTSGQIIQGQLNMDYTRCCPKDLEPVFVVNGFSFSKALCDACRDTGKETLEQIATAMNYCIGQNLKKYQYKQYFFENFIPASQEFFIEIYFAERYKWRKDVDDLIVAFYSEFEPETREELDKILQESLYLKAHSELIPRIRACFAGYF